MSRGQKKQQQIDAGALQALEQWRQFRPKMYRELEKRGRLYVAAQQRRT
jgi:hypothetical protein